MIDMIFDTLEVSKNGETVEMHGVAETDKPYELIATCDVTMGTSVFEMPNLSLRSAVVAFFTGAWTKSANVQFEFYSVDRKVAIGLSSTQHDMRMASSECFPHNGWWDCETRQGISYYNTSMTRKVSVSTDQSYGVFLNSSVSDYPTITKIIVRGLDNAPSDLQFKIYGVRA